MIPAVDGPRAESHAFARVACLAAIAAFLTSCGPRLEPRLEVLEQGTSRRSNYQFAHESWWEPRLAQLRRQEGLDEYRRPPEKEWESILALADWTNAQWAPGDPDPYPNSNGVEILDAIRSGRTGGFCAQYAYLYADALKSLGHFDVRHVELETRDNRAHFTTEVWSNQHQKWVIVDPYFNAYHAGPGGEPLGALELHRMLAEGEDHVIETRVIRQRDDIPSADGSLEYYFSVAVALRNDHAARERPSTVQERLDTYLHLASPAHEGWEPRMRYRQQSSREEDFTAAVNQAFIDCDPLEGEEGWSCALSTGGTVAHFGGFLVTEDGGESWRPSTPRHAWRPSEPGSTLSAVAVSVVGKPSRPVTVRHGPR